MKSLAPALVEQSDKLRRTSERFELSAHKLEGETVALNGAELRLSAQGGLPTLKGMATPAGTIALAPATITFLAIPEAGNQSCH